MFVRFFFPLLFIIFISHGAFPVQETGVPEVIISAIKTGNAKELAKFFNQNVELILFNEENVYSKAQAELILKDFFSKNIPSDFTVLHQGGKDGAKYAIGSVKTSTGNFRVYFLLKIKSDQPYIHQLRIEKE